VAELFDRKVYFDAVRQSLFSGALSQQQVDGQNAILADWEGSYGDWDLRWLAYALATTIHETASTMWPIEEYGKGAGMAYGIKDPETGQTYYGRGYVQLTWRENYRKADQKLGHEGDERMEWNASLALDPFTAGHVMFRGMAEGWFRSDQLGGQTFGRYFSDNVNDAYTAREIINGDKTKIPTWSNGVSIGNLIKGYHSKFLSALKASYHAPAPAPEPEPEPTPTPEVLVAITQPPGVRIVVTINGAVVGPSALDTV
jgi:hypothetical protein